MPPGPRILLVGGRSDDTAALIDLLSNAGFDRSEPGDLGATVAGDPPDLLIIAGEDAAFLCGAARDIPHLLHVPVLAIVAALPVDAAMAALAAGADDVVIEPLTAAVLGARVRRMIRAGVHQLEAQLTAHCQRALVDVQNVIDAGGDSPEALREALLIAVELMGFERASLIGHVEGSEKAFVIAATDDPTLSKFTLRVSQYPELLEVFRTRNKLLIADGSTHPVTAPVVDALEKKGVRAIAVFPVMWKGRVLGAVRYRRSAAGVDHLSERLLVFGGLFAGALAAQLRDGELLRNLREQTHRVSRARYEAERRLRAVDALKPYFDSAADGVVILDDAAHILFVNKAAEEVTGFARDGLLGSSLTDLVGEPNRKHLREVIGRVLAGTNLEPFDLEVPAAGAQVACMSVATSTVLASSGAVILTLRDVTEHRQLEAELRKTKDFLEKLIDSTVDAIIAADIDGDIMLFNTGAERIYGYSAHAVIDRMKVDVLYPDGVARQVMRMLRSTSYGGVGRLEQTRREILASSGELIPVNMTASILYEQGREVATVGIFSDLRERIRIEQRLLQAQEKLEISEKQALIAELAGAAAHELNQPLTSIMGYLELVQRKIDADDVNARAIGVIEREAARMAGIVKRIGRITRYETKEYVGSASILDLEKSAGGGDEGAVQRRRADTEHDNTDDDEPTAVVDPGSLLR